MENDRSLFHGNLVSTRRILYTPSSFAKENLLHLQETGSLQATRPHTSSRSDLSSYLFFIVRSGSGKLVFEGKTYALHRGDCIFLSCLLPYSHTTSNDLWELVWAHFDGISMPGIYRKYRERGGGPVFHPASLTPFEECLFSLYRTASSDDYIRDMRINESLSHLLSLIMGESWHPENGTTGQGKSDAALRAKSYLDAHYMDHITLDALASECYLNKYYLTRVFREKYGTTIGNYLNEVRIGEAKRLLRFSDDSLSEIGAQVGIPDANYLSRLFTRIEGISPTVYRKSWQGKS